MFGLAVVFFFVFFFLALLWDLRNKWKNENEARVLLVKAFSYHCIMYI